MIGEVVEFGVRQLGAVLSGLGRQENRLLCLGSTAVSAQLAERWVWHRRAGLGEEVQLVVGMSGSRQVG